MSTVTESRPAIQNAAPDRPLLTGEPTTDPNPDRRSATTARGRAHPSPATPSRIDDEAFLAGAFAEYVDADSTLPRYVVRHPRQAMRVIRALTALPAFDAELPRSYEAPAVQRLLLEHGATRRMMLGVSAILPVPTVAGTYTDGSDRATVRRKIRAAEKQSVTVRPARADERAYLLSLANAHELTNERAEYRVEQPDNDDLLDYALWLVALDGDGEPIMLSVTPTAGEWGVLRYFRTLTAGQASSDARYLMARELAEALCARGVRYLVDSSRPHWLPNGLRHFQRMIGFRLVRVRRVRITGR